MDNKKIIAPCPFCGGHLLDTNMWTLEDEEVDAVECKNCYAGAPLATWNGMMLYNPWTDYEDFEPDDGQRVLCYTLISQKQYKSALRPLDIVIYKDCYLSGPSTRVVQKEFINDGTHNPIAYWQPIAGLPQ